MLYMTALPGSLFDGQSLMLPIAETLNDEGVASPAGKLWSKNTVHFILKNEVYTGTLIWGAKSKPESTDGQGWTA